MADNHRIPTSADVAQLAGVSRTTVSYVLNETPGLSIKQETRERVWAAARELNYQVQPAARALRKGQSDDIYFISDRPLTLFYRDLIQVYHRRAKELGYNLIVCFSDGLSSEAQRDFLLRAFSNRPAGVIVSSETISQELIDLARSKGAGPLISAGAVQLGTEQDNNHYTFEGARLIVEHLVERGHQSIGMLAPQPNYLRSLVEARIVAVREALERLGKADIHILPVAASTLDAARQVAARLRENTARPSAIFGFNDEYSLPLLRALQEQGFRVPQDIAIAGTDNLAFSEMLMPSLTTVSYDIEAIGTRGIELIDALLHSDGSDAVVTAKPLPPPTLIVREST